MKRSLLVEAAGGPLAVVIAGANVHDTKLLAATMDAIVVEQQRSNRSGRSICVWISATTIPRARRQ